MGRLERMDPIEIAGELYDRAREVTQMAVGEAKRFAASEQGRRIRHNIATGLIVTLALETTAYLKVFRFPAGVTASAVAMVSSFLVFFVVSWLTRDNAAAEIDPDIRLVMDI